MNRVANLIEETQNLVQDLHEDSEDMISAYAYAAIASETLSERFEAIAQAVYEAADTRTERELASELITLAEDLMGLAEEAATAAESLTESEEQGSFTEDVDSDSLEEHFRDLMGGLLEAIEVYAEFTEDADPS